MSAHVVQVSAEEFCEHVAELVPVFTAPPGDGGQEFRRTAGWSMITRERNAERLACAGENYARMALLGDALAVVDVDTKNGADVEKVRRTLDGIGVRVYAEVLTPSGGRHFYVAGHPDLPSVAATEGRDGLTGLPGVEILSHGRNAFLPGTRRPKYDGAGYAVLSDDLATLADGGDPDSAEALVGWVAANRVRKPETFAPAEPWSGGPPDHRQQRYLEATLQGIYRELSVMGRDSGRNSALNVAAVKCGGFIAGAGMDEARAVEMLRAACETNGLSAEDGQRSVDATIASGLRFGKQSPRAVPAAKEAASVAELVPVGASAKAPNAVGADPALCEIAREHRGQARMAYRLAMTYGGQLLHVYGLGWHAWDGRRWVEDRTGAAKRAVLEVLREALAESIDDKELRADVRKCESASGVNGVLDLAAALEPFAVQVDDLDADPYLLNTAGGTLDLRTMEVRPPDPGDRITKVARGAYLREPTSGATEWTSFLERVLPDAEVRGFLQRLAGVGLLGEVVEHVLGIATGTGANGKTVFTETLGHALGDYAVTPEPDLLMHRDGSQHPTGLMDLRGARWAVTAETDEGRRLAAATVKRLTGGETLKARRMRQDFVEFKPSHTVLMVTNFLPKVQGDDPALWRRLRVVPFDVVIAEAERDSHLTERLRLQADAVLTWAVQGYADYRARGRLDEPESVRVATDAYQRDSDAVARFLDEECIKNPNMHTETADLFERWGSWRQHEGAEELNRKAFGQALDRHGYPATKSNGRRIRRGLGLFAAGDEQ